MIWIDSTTAPGVPCVVALLGMAAMASAQEGSTLILRNGDRLIVPEGSLVHMVSVDPEQPYATFVGRFVISGPYSVGCHLADEEECGLDDLEMDIEPDDALLARLPRWDIIERRKPLIQILDAVAFLKASLDVATLRSLESRSIEEETGNASIVVDCLITGADCDAYWYQAHFGAFAPEPETAQTRVSEGNSGCGWNPAGR